MFVVVGVVDFYCIDVALTIYHLQQDIRADAFQKRRRCYDIIFSVILSIDNAMLASPQSPVGHGELPALSKRAR